MTYAFRPAAASEAKPLVGLYAESGNGKTYSALLLAKGFVTAMGGTMHDVGMIETEAGRGEAFADDQVVGGYRALPLRENFSPANYGKAIAAAEQAGLRALIVDSASHEWEGVGGVLSMAAKNQADGKKGQIVWQEPKIQHQREFMLRLLQTPIPLVTVCMRAKYPMKEATAEDVEEVARSGKRPPKVGDWMRSLQLSPKQSDDILYEMFVHGWIDDAHRFHGTKYTIAAMREIFRNGEPISEETGKRLALWATKRDAPPAADLINADQVANLETLCQDNGISQARREKAGIPSLQAIKSSDYQRALDWINSVARARSESRNTGSAHP